MPYAIQVYEQGGPEVMRWEKVAEVNPKPGEALIRQTAVGLNYIDVYQRSGGYKLDLPARIGMEGVGVVEAIGEGVDHVKVGSRVGYVMGPQVPMPKNAYTLRSDLSHCQTTLVTRKPQVCC